MQRKQKSLSPHKLRHFLFTWLKKQGIDDALIQPYSGHKTRQSLEIYSKLSLVDSQKVYDEIIVNFLLNRKGINSYMRYINHDNPSL